MRYRDISIRKKILLSNFLMILIPVIFVCAILAIMLLSFSILTDSSSSIIRNVLLNSSNYGPTLLIKSMSDELRMSDSINDDVKALFKKMEDANLHIMVEEEGKYVYISDHYTPQMIQDEFTQISQAEHYELPYIIWNQEGMAYATKLRNKEEKELTLTFSGRNLALAKDSYASWEQTKLNIKIMIVVTGFTIILLILLLGVFLTKKLSRYILHPLSKLQNATNEIRSGNLNFGITSTTHDEFGILCENFEDMREQLVTSDTIQKQYEQQRKELLVGISHDLSTPLTSIQGYVHGLLDGIADTPEKQRHYLEIIQSKTELVNELVESLFLLSKLDMGEEPMQLSKTNLHEYLREWTKREQQKYAEQGLSLSFTDDTYDAWVQLDHMLFIRVLNNLCDNSMKYRIGKTVHVAIHLGVDNDTCTLSIKDDGMGATKEEIQHLFERFYRVDPSRSSKIKGNGLGLSITKHIIELMHGSIKVESNAQQGLCFYIQLPLYKEEHNEENINH